MYLSNYGIKHLIKCRCVLPQYKNQKEPTIHHFVVFSEVKDDEFKPKYAQCNNCGLIHKVIDICKSEILQNKEELKSLVKIEDLEQTLPENLKNILVLNKCDLATWEYASYLYLNKMWGNFVVLTQEYDPDEQVENIKYLLILGENMFKVENTFRSNVIKKEE